MHSTSFESKFGSSSQHQNFHLLIPERREVYPHSASWFASPKLNPANGRHSCPKAENCKQKAQASPLHPVPDNHHLRCWVCLDNHYGTLPKGGEVPFPSLLLNRHSLFSALDLDGCCARNEFPAAFLYSFCRRALGASGALPSSPAVCCREQIDKSSGAQTSWQKWPTKDLQSTTRSSRSWAVRLPCDKTISSHFANSLFL